MIYTFYRQISKMLEQGFYIITTGPLSEPELQKLHWLIAETFEPTKTKTESEIESKNALEIGPRISIETPFSSNAVAICQAMGLSEVTRIERTRRYNLLEAGGAELVTKKYLDRMTEEIYPHGPKNFDSGIQPEPIKVVDLIGRGVIALAEANKDLGLGMDAKDIEYYHNLFVNVLKRNPTDVELFQLGNANSEHSRHWYFKGQLCIDGAPTEKTLFQIVQEPLEKSIETTGVPYNSSLIAFRDNAGAVKGFETKIISPLTPGRPSELRLLEKIVHPTCTAETHNHPTFVAPFPGAQTGAGGRIRDNTAVGRGGKTGFGVAGYYVGNLFISGYPIPGEIAGENKPSQYASPLEILIEASNGVSSYGNEFGEPLIGGFTRTFGQNVGGEWIEPRKPILYSGGVGHLFDENLKKENPEVGMLIVRIGGPAYPIGVGGGSASSMMQGENTENLDFNSVQRGNAEMENRANRVILACNEMNVPIISSIHDQGAGGPSNVLTELMEPVGGYVNIEKIVLGDKTMSVLKIWSAEFQEGYGLLIRPERIELFQTICKRERVNCEILGEIDGKGKVVVKAGKQLAVELDLKQILTEMPQKTFETVRRKRNLTPLCLPKLKVEDALKAVFALPQVGSKGFLTRKVDRSVTGLVAQQQCCGIAQIPVADVAMNAQSHFDVTGSAAAIGERPSLMLIDPKAGARMAVGEMLTNMASANIRSLDYLRCRANWMWPAKLPHEGADLYDAAVAMSDLMIKVGIAVDGGKDSLSMAATVSGELVKSPGSLVVLGYAPVPNITKKVTPDIKCPGKSRLALIDLGLGKNRLGGSSLAQACEQLGDESPDVDDPELLQKAFQAIQAMTFKGIILSCHDRSDGGLITAVAEMCMASQCGFEIETEKSDHREVLAELFSEELGFIVEINPEKEAEFIATCDNFDIPFVDLGKTRSGDICIISSGMECLFLGHIPEIRMWWEETSYQIECRQVDPLCAASEHATNENNYYGGPRGAGSTYQLTFDPKDTNEETLLARGNPKVAVIREEGTNGDREMQAACFAAGLQPWDITMSDLLTGKMNLDDFRGIIFAGGFSFMDVFDSAKGWAGAIMFNKKLRDMFDRFYWREDTFSLGVCNGCQLMALLGWVPWKRINPEKQPRFVHNTSGRFESRWAQVEILPSPAMMLKGMEGSRLGVWVAHGEGRLFYPDESIKKVVVDENLAPLAYIDPFGNKTEQYPFNPNGSPGGITALCSPEGRHLAMMPHPERCFRLWQWPWMPSSWDKLEASPWLQMFQNARKWCLEYKPVKIK